MILANVLNTFPFKTNLVFSKDPKGLLKIPPDYTILCNWVFDNFIPADKPWEKAFRSLKLGY